MKIAFYKGETFVDKTVIFLSRGGYSHCTIVFDDGSIIESKPFCGVQKCEYFTSSLESNCLIDIFEVYTTKHQDKIIKEFLEKQLGKGYDYLSVIGFVVYATDEGRKKYGRWFCSELVFAAFKKAGINLMDRTDAWLLSPTILSYNTKMNFVESVYFRYQQQ